MADPERNVDMLKRQRVLADFGEFALCNENLDAVLTEVCCLVADALGTVRAKVLEIQGHEPEQVLFVRAGVGWDPSVVGRVRMPMGERSSETFAINAGTPVFSQDIAGEERFVFPEFMRKAGVVALVNVPIRLPGGRAYGLLQVDATEPRDFGHEDTEFLRTYATILGPVIDRLQKLGTLHVTEERFRLVVENARDYAIFTSDPEDRITDWYRGAETVYGWSAEEAIGQPAAIIFTPEDRETGQDVLETEIAARDGSAPNVRWHLRKDGARVFIDGSVVALRDEAGGLRGFQKIGQDVTKRRLEEEANREREVRQAFLLALSDALRPLSGADETIAVASRLLAEHLEASRVIYFRVEDAPDGFRVIAAAQNVREGQPFPERVRYDAFHDGAVGRTLEEGGRMVVANSATDARLSAVQRRMWSDAGVGAAAAVPLVKNGRVVAIVGAQQDRPRDWTAADLDVIGEVAERTWAASERARAEEALRESEARHSFLIGSWAQAVWETDADGVVNADSPSWRAHTGQTLQEWLGYGWLDAIHPDDRAYAERQWREAISARGLVDAEFRLRAPSGGWRWTNVRAAPVLTAGGKIAKWAGMNIDIDARKQAEAALRESEERLRQFGEASQDVLWIRDAETLQWIYLTQAFEETYGLDREAALTGDTMTSWLELIMPEDRQAVLDSLQQVRAGERVSFEYRILRPGDGELRWLRDTDFPMRDGAGRVCWIGGVGRDITEEKAAARRQEVLVNELQHRARNLLGVVAAVADRTVKQGGSVQGFEERLQALSRAQGLLSKGGSDTVEVGELLRAELAAHADGASDRVVISGPKVLLSARQVQNFALAVHELTTNAVK